ncbi:cytochrome P450 [Ilyonectria destructans]|nr:cytochrome P450 [Ilyonectria destructans]
MAKLVWSMETAGGTTKGTWIIGNIWSIHRDPKCFLDPDVFKPELFMSRDREPPFPVKRGHSAFGWGRRQCSGQPLAEQGLFLTFARLLWSFDMKPALRLDGTEEEMNILAFNESENMRAEPFRVRFIPKSEKRVHIIQSEAVVAREFLRQYDGETRVVMEALEV